MKKAIYLDVNLCVGCGACAVACMDQNDIYPETGQPELRRIYQIEEELVSGIGIKYLSVACQHCADSPCAMGCPTGAISKDSNTGSVTVDQDRCIGCHSCALACPFGIPRYDAQGKLQKCSLCIERVEAGLEPACVRVCPMGALKFEEVNLLQQEREFKIIGKVAKTK